MGVFFFLPVSDYKRCFERAGEYDSFCFLCWMYLKSIRAGAAVVVHRVIGTCAVVLAGVGQAGITLSLDIYIHWAYMVHQSTQIKHIHRRDD